MRHLWEIKSITRYLNCSRTMYQTKENTCNGAKTDKRDTWPWGLAMISVLIWAVHEWMHSWDSVNYQLKIWMSHWILTIPQWNENICLMKSSFSWHQTQQNRLARSPCWWHGGFCFVQQGQVYWSHGHPESEWCQLSQVARWKYGRGCGGINSGYEPARLSLALVTINLRHDLFVLSFSYL